MPESFIPCPVRFLDHDGNPDCSVRMENSLTQVGEEVCVVSVQLEKMN